MLEGVMAKKKKYSPTKEELKSRRHKIRKEYNKKLMEVQERDPKTGRFGKIKEGATSPPFPPILYPLHDEIWTVDFVNQELDLVLSKLLEQQDIMSYKGLFETRPYTKRSFSYYVKKFGHPDSPKYDATISQKVEKIREILEDRIVDAGLNGGGNPIFKIFLLKNKYEGYEDKKVVEHDHKIAEISESKQAMLIEMKKLKNPSDVVSVVYEADDAE